MFVLEDVFIAPFGIFASKYVRMYTIKVDCTYCNYLVFTKFYCALLYVRVWKPQNLNTNFLSCLDEQNKRFTYIFLAFGPNCFCSTLWDV